MSGYDVRWYSVTESRENPGAWDVNYPVLEGEAGLTVYASFGPYAEKNLARDSATFEAGRKNCLLRQEEAV